MNIALTGFMGSGKSSVGKELAKKLGFKFVDTDDMIEKTAGVSINEIFARHGEKYFREIEAKIIKDISKENSLVIATGGGAVLNPENIKNLRVNGVVVYLSVTPEQVYERVKNETHRPLLKCANPLAEIKKLLDNRKTAHDNNDFVFDAGSGAPQEIAGKIAGDAGVLKMLKEKE